MEAPAHVVIVALLAGLFSATGLCWLVFRRFLKTERDRLSQELSDSRALLNKETARRMEEIDTMLHKREEEQERIFEQREVRVASRERELEQAEARRAEQSGALDKRTQNIERRAEEIDERSVQLDEEMSVYRERLQGIAGLTPARVKEEILEEARRECEDELRIYKNEILNRAEAQIEAEASRLLLVCMQRLSSTPQQDATATIVSIPNEDMKGRIIGREGRNIKAFESATGTTLLIDETPDSVLVSSFDPVRREVARLALEHLIKDGRIHPTSIEAAVLEADDQVKTSVSGFGEDALRRVRISHVHPEIVQLLGKLRYRLSFNQNCLDHTVEVSQLCGLIAAELGLDTEIARRAGLFHDIGKSLDADYEGSHASAGANILKRLGEDDLVVNAVASHHEEVAPISAYASVLKIADAVSAVRPGARAESMDSYIQRVRKLEDLARSMPGVNEAFAIQAGREIRVVVAPDNVDDSGARELARKLRRRIEDELQYPGTIKITVIRECRYVEQAR
ncbi:MAG: ribonuclease Y [Opitutales bacterium]